MINRDNIYIILKNTLYPGNIGATARVMANFGLKNMILIKPNCQFTTESYKRARYASGIFENAPIMDSLSEVASVIDILVGTSRRGAYRLHMRMSPRLSAQEIDNRYSHVKLGFVFGDEKAGLSNEDLKKCAWYFRIPSHPNFESLNLSHSVAVIAYEIYLKSIKNNDELHKFPADSKQMEALFKHIIKFLKILNFPDRGERERVYADVKRVVSSADFKQTDISLIHGLMRVIEEKYLGGWV